MENLYETLNNKVNDNVANANNLKEEKRKVLIDSQYHEAEIRDRYNVIQIKAYYFYKYFITNVLSMLIKESIETSHDLTLKDAEHKKFNYELQVTKKGDDIIQFYKLKNFFYISFSDYLTYEEFIKYLDAFCLRCGVNTSNEYLSGKKYYFDNLTIGDILNAYYGELQRFEFNDKLITDIQEEENTSVNGKELTKDIIRR